MIYKWILPILLISNVHCGTNNDVHKQRRSLSATKVPRFNSLTGNFEDQNSPENYFPDVEYPSDILDVGKPYYFKASDDAVLEPFPRDVKNSFKSISHSGKAAKVPVTQNIEVSKSAQPGLKTSGNLIKTLPPKNNTNILDNQVTNVTIDSKIDESEPQNDDVSVLHNKSTTEIHNQESYTEEVLATSTMNITFDSQESVEDIGNNDANVTSKISSENLGSEESQHFIELSTLSNTTNSQEIIDQSQENKSPASSDSAECLD